MSYEDIQEAQKKRDKKGQLEQAAEGRKQKNLQHWRPEPWRGKKSRVDEIEGANREIRALVMREYCSVF
jgi:hypothetical protein